MEIELSELTYRYRELRVQCPGRRGRLLASLAAHGQQSPVLVIADGSFDGRFVLIDGYARTEALRGLGRDVCLAAVLDMSEVEALLMCHRLGSRNHRSALEEGWLFAQLIEEHSLSQRAVAARVSRSVGFVAQRLALVRALPSSVQAKVRAGQLPAHAAGKYLAPFARANSEHAERLMKSIGAAALSDRQVERLYLGWRRAVPEARERIVDDPLLFLKAEDATRAKDARVPDNDPAAPLLRDLENAAGLCRRARRRLSEGLLHELDDKRRAHVRRTFEEARLALSSLAAILDEDSCSTETHAQPS